MSFLEMRNITVQYEGTKKACLEDLNFTMEKGEIVVILGPSGCGKSTLLKTVSGLVHQKNGDVFIDGELMNKRSTEKRSIAMVFQNPYLFRNMTVEDNINFAPRVNNNMPKSEMIAETERIIKLVRLEGLAKRKANQLSGGQEQRVSLGRALMVRPKLLLLDEPFSALDAQLRTEMRENVRSIFKEIGQSAIFVTHDQQEAATMADRIAVMSNGKILQYDTPKELFSHPNSLEVAKFLGWNNIISSVQKGDTITSAIGTFELQGIMTDDGDVYLLIPAEGAKVSVNGRLTGRIVSVRQLGIRTEYRVECNGQFISVMFISDRTYNCGEEIRFDLDTSHMWTVAAYEEAETEPDDVPKESFLKRLFKR